MRIGVDARPLQRMGDGISRYTGEILRRLTEDSPHQWFLYASQPLMPLPWLERPSVRVRSATCSSAWASALCAQFNYPRWADEDRLDVFWSPRHHLPVARMRVREVVTIHDFVWKVLPETMLRSKVASERLLTPWSLRKASSIIAVSQSTAADVRAAFPHHAEKISVTLLAGNCFCTSNLPDSDGEPFCLFVGTLEPRKNLQRCLAGYAQARRACADVPKLKVVGGQGWRHRPATEIIGALELDDCVEYLGKVDDEALSHLYRRCQFLLHPALYEGFALPVIEAMSHGKPVITSNLSSMPEVAGEAGLLVDPLAPADIADAILRICTDGGLFDELAQRARQRASRFSWDRTAAETLAILEDDARSPAGRTSH